MKAKQFALFRKTKAIEGMIDNFLDSVSEAGMRFEQGMNTYVEFGPEFKLAGKVGEMRRLEGEGNRLRREIEAQLYSEMLIPDFRGDVLSLLENLNFLLGLIEDIFLATTVEQPEISDPFKADFKLLVETAVLTVESAVLASRAFFRNIALVRDHLSKVGFYEEEADQISTRLKQKIFPSDMPLEKKMHLRYFVDKIDNLADEAEAVGDRLTIYCIKRAL